MKIVDVCGFYSETGGGVRGYVQEKLRRAAAHGHEFTVVAPGAESRVEALCGGRIVWVASPRMPFDPNYRFFHRAREVWRAIDAADPDIVEGSSPWLGGWLAGAWPGRAVKALVFHQDFVAGYPHTLLDGVLPRPAIERLFGGYWRYLRALSARFDATITAGAWLAERLAAFGIHRPTAIPFGVEPGRFSPARRDEALRRVLLARCGVEPGGGLVLAVGRFHPEKRYRTIIEGFARAKSDRPLGLVIVGDGLRRAPVERLARRAGHVYLAGAIADRDQIARLYASADVLAHGSGAETYGLVVAEAVASGLPVVVPDAGGAADLAAFGHARRYATGDAGALAAAILAILSDPGAPAGPARIGTSDDHFTALFGLYERLIAAKARQGREDQG